MVAECQNRKNGEDGGLGSVLARFDKSKDSEELKGIVSSLNQVRKGSLRGGHVSAIVDQSSIRKLEEEQCVQR